jgi:hypothetical protein
MYGNKFDYTGVQPDVDRSYLQSIMDDTRSTVSGLKTDPVALVEELAAGRGDRFDDAGIGNVGDYLEEVYTPYVPNDTPSYSEFMADTPRNIKKAIGAYQKKYFKGADKRTENFQNLLQDVNNFGTVDMTDGEGAAAAELKALNPRLKVKRFKAQDRTPEESLANFREQFGSGFSLNDYNRALEQGQNEEQLQNRLKKYYNYGANILPKVKDMGFLKPKSKVEEKGKNWWLGPVSAVPVFFK